MKKIKLALLIPVHDEYPILSEVIGEIQQEILRLSKFNVVIYILNNGSSDNSLEKLVELQIKYKNIIIIEIQSNVGKIKAQSIGLMNALQEYDFYVFMDGDGQHDPKYIKDMIEISSRENKPVLSLRTRYKRSLISQIGVWALVFLSKLFGYKFDSNIGEFFCLPKKNLDRLSSDERLGSIPLVLLIQSITHDFAYLKTPIRPRLQNLNISGTESKSKHSLIELYRKGLYILFNDPYKALFRILMFSILTLAVLSAYGLWIGLNALFSHDLSGVASIVLIQIILACVVIIINLALSLFIAQLILTKSAKLDSFEYRVLTIKSGRQWK
jgi:glycosyltransferase involved in cell wall biosynthesis